MIELKKRFLSFKRYIFALAIFSIALVLRFALFPVEAPFPFITFAPATIICFYFLGVRAGIFITTLFSVTTYYVFVPPHWAWAIKPEANVRVFGFVLCCILIGCVIKKLQQISFEQSIMLDNKLVGIFKLQKRKIVWVNNAIPNLLGYEKKELAGQDTRILYPDDETYTRLGESAYPILASGETYRSQQTLLKKNGESIWVDMHGASLPGKNNESLWIMVDITTLKRQQEAIEIMAYHDVLTGLPNRLLLTDRLEQALAHAQRNNKFLAVCYLDLDGFKPINDTYGHAAGDKLLARVARCMQVATRSNDTVSRLGGDEFVILLTNLDTIDEYKVVLDRVIAAINQPVSIDEDTTVHVTASIGISIYPINSDNADSLLRFADEAMYVGKRSGRNCTSLYQDSEDQKLPRALLSA